MIIDLLNSHKMFLQLVIVVTVALLCVSASTNSISTPFGRIHRDCVHVVPSDARLVDSINVREIHYANGKVDRFNACTSALKDSFESISNATALASFPFSGLIEGLVFLWLVGNLFLTKKYIRN